MKKEYFCCPVAEMEDSKDAYEYTTDDCGACVCFWDCVTGLRECLKDPDYYDDYEEIKESLEYLGG